jgi:hypothetical protein
VGRLDRVQIALDGGVVEIPWASREALLARLPDSNLTRSVREAFTTVGASHPVRLTNDEKAHLLIALTVWDAEFGPSQLPDGLDDLERGLIADLPDRPEDDAG